MKKIIGGVLLLAIAAIAAFNVNFNLNESNNLSSIALANVEALANPEDSEFKYAIDKDKPCLFQVQGEAHVSAIAKFLGIKAKAGASVDLADGTSLYKLGGNYRLGKDVTCADARQSLLDVVN